MSSEASRRRREMGFKASEIFREHITSTTKQLQKILVPFKMELVQARIISEDAIDLGVLGIGQLLMASNLYSTLTTAMEVMPRRFPDVVAIFYKFPELYAIAEEMEEQGIAAGLMTSPVKREKLPCPPTQKKEDTVVVAPDTLSDPPTLVAFLENVAVEMPAKWRIMGLQLGISPANLDGFEQQHRGEPMRCFERVFQLWEQKSPGTFAWSTLFAVLEKKLVGENVLAKSLRQKYVEC